MIVYISAQNNGDELSRRLACMMRLILFGEVKNQAERDKSIKGKLGDVRRRYSIRERLGDMSRNKSKVKRK